MITKAGSIQIRKVSPDRQKTLRLDLTTNEDLDKSPNTQVKQVEKKTRKVEYRNSAECG